MVKYEFSNKSKDEMIHEDISFSSKSSLNPISTNNVLNTRNEASDAFFFFFFLFVCLFCFFVVVVFLPPKGAEQNLFQKQFLKLFILSSIKYKVTIINCISILRLQYFGL